MIKLVKKEKPKGIWVGDMKDGDVGIIVDWTVAMCLDEIVQRYHNNLVGVGMSGGNGWSNLFINDDLSTNCRVRLLEKGDILIVV
jgi:hypothetical protein